MGIDATPSTRGARTLCNRQAAALYGAGWECSETGAEVWQRLVVNAAAPGSVLLASEALALGRATRLLRRRRLQVHMTLEQMQARAASLRSIPFARLLVGRTFAQLQEQIRQQEQSLAQLPAEPAIHRLDPDGDAGVPADAMKVGKSIWFLHKPTLDLFACAIVRAQIEPVDEVRTLVYETAGSGADGKAIRRTCAHDRGGLKTLGGGEIAFMDPSLARDYVRMHLPPASAPVRAEPPTQAEAGSAARADRAASRPPAQRTAVAGFDESHAATPFHESMLN